MLIACSEKPVIKLVCNRYNNKYSYTQQSDDNLLLTLEVLLVPIDFSTVRKLSIRSLVSA